MPETLKENKNREEEASIQLILDCNVWLLMLLNSQKATRGSHIVNVKLQHVLSV